MCVCILIPENGTVSEDRLREAHKANPDGCGVLWANNGRLICHKGCYSFDDFLVFYRRAVRPAIVHFRTASSGTTDNTAAHPLFVNEKLAFTENGNIFEYGNAFYSYSDNLTDIQRFNELFLKKLPEGFIFDHDIMAQIQSYCVNRMVKMIFMNNFGKVAIVNESAGEWKNGCWFSNGGIENYVGYGYSGAYPYREGERRNLGGLGSVQTFDEKERKLWSQCKTCLGWFPNKDIQKSACVGCREWKKLVELTK